MIRFFIVMILTLSFASPIFAGGGPPKNFKDYKYFAQYLENKINQLEEGVEIPETITSCEYWTALTDEVMYYMTYEAKFVSQQRHALTNNIWKIRWALKTGEGIMMLDTFKFRKQRAKHRLQLMKDWNQTFKDLFVTAWHNRRVFCDPEYVCNTPTLLSSIYVWSNELLSYDLLPGDEQTVFSFSLTAAAVGNEVIEDAKIYSIYMAMQLHGNDTDYGKITNCQLQTEYGMTLGQQTDLIIDDSANVAFLAFNMQPGGPVIESGNTETFVLVCDIEQYFDGYTALEVGFMEAYGTSPVDAIYAYGQITDQQLPIDTNGTVITVLSNY